MSELGTPTKVFSANMTTFSILVGVAAIGCLIAVASVWMGLNRYHAPPSILDEMSFGEASRKSSLVNGSIMAAINLAVAAGCVAAAIFQKSVRLEINQNGIVSRRGRNRDVAMWETIIQVKEYKFDSVTHGSNVRRRTIRYFVTVHTSDGRELLLRGFENVRRAGELIAEYSGTEIERVAI